MHRPLLLGQVWCPAHVPRTDVNPRPLSPLVPDIALYGEAQMPFILA